MSRWGTTSTLDADVPPAEIWREAYEDAEAWPRWNAEIKREDGRLLTNTIYIKGPLSGLWRRIMGPAAARTLPNAQRSIVGLAQAT